MPKRYHLKRPAFAPASTNFTWFTINYCLALTNRWPACFENLQTAIRWVKNASEIKGAPNHIALLGYSASGHLVTMASTLSNTEIRVQAVAVLAPPTDLVADNERRKGLSPSMRALFGFESINITAGVRLVLRQNSPLTHVRPDLPSFLIINGSADRTVPLVQTENFAAALKSASTDVTLITRAVQLNLWALLTAH